MRTLLIVLALLWAGSCWAEEEAAPALAEESVSKDPYTQSAKAFFDFYWSNKEHDLAKMYVRGLVVGFSNAAAKLKADTGREVLRATALRDCRRRARI